jgi:hypothetical protein
VQCKQKGHHMSYVMALNLEWDCGFPRRIT